MPTVFGIDLGTTNSCVAYIDAFGKAVVQRNANGDTTTPSVVFYPQITQGSKNRIVVGRVAKNQRIRFPERTIASIKRKMDVPGAEIKLPDGRKLTPVDVSAAILKALVDEANAGLDPSQRTYDVVITCPAYFSATARQNTKDAGIAAGLNVLQILAEPTAAAISFAQSVNIDGNLNFLVFDLGGGTLDLTILQVDREGYRAIATSGDAHLGGDDWDRCLAELLVEKYNRQCNGNYLLDNFEKNDRRTYYKFLAAAEELKRNLSSQDQDSVYIGINGQLVNIDVSRKEFEQVSKGLMDRVLNAFRKVLDSAAEKNFQMSSQSRIILVGGSSRMPMIRRELMKALNNMGINMLEQNFVCHEPDLSIALGAAYVADSWCRNQTGVADNTFKCADGSTTKFTDVTAKSYGISCIDSETKRTIVENIIRANADLPAEKTATFLTEVTNQPSAMIEIYESASMEEVIDPEQADKIDAGKQLCLPAGLPARTPIDVTFYLDTQGLLTVKAKLSNGNHQGIEFDVKLNGILSKEEKKAAADKLNDSDISRT